MTDAPRTVILLSTPTSATGSIWRACQALGTGRYKPEVGRHGLSAARPRGTRSAWMPQEHGRVVLCNWPHLLDTAGDLSRWRFVVNTRDPRDLACNQYHWKMVHPSPGDRPGDLEARAEAARSLGIDAFALRAGNRELYRGLRELTERAPRENWIFLGYALWCLRFDEAVARLARFMGVDLAALPAPKREAVMRERVPEGNPRWIGQRWEGADTAPGRHRRELRPETVAALTAKYAEELRWLRDIDDPAMAALYD
jgi:hypothetical protein